MCGLGPPTCLLCLNPGWAGSRHPRPDSFNDRAIRRLTREGDVESGVGWSVKSGVCRPHDRRLLPLPSPYRDYTGETSLNGTYATRPTQLFLERLGTQPFAPHSELPPEGEGSNRSGCDTRTEQRCHHGSQASSTSLFHGHCPGRPGSCGFSSPVNGLVTTRSAVRTLASATTPGPIFGSRLPAGANVEASGLGGAELTSVSCPSSGFCAAVDAAGFAYIYKRGAWSAGQKIASGTSRLNSVSCPTALFCIAVAGSTNGTGGSTYLYSQGRWSSGKHFTTDGYGESSVSCPAVSRCVVVGWGGVHRYSNGVWSSQASFAGTVTSLTCTSIVFCVALQRDRGDGGIVITFVGTGDGQTTRAQ